MSGHFDRERELQHRIEAELGEALPDFEVLEVELDEPKETVRVFIDHPQGVGFDECVAVNDVIRDTCPDHALEVSSPGMERPLRYARHFEQHIGETVRLRRAGKLRVAHVRLVAVSDSEGLTVLQPESGEEQVVPFGEIVRCRLVVEDPFASGRKSRRAKRKGRS